MTRSKTDFLCQRTCKIRPNGRNFYLWTFCSKKLKFLLRDSYSRILQRFKLIAVVLDSIMEWEFQLCLQQWEKC